MEISVLLRDQRDYALSIIVIFPGSDGTKAREGGEKVIVKYVFCSEEGSAAVTYSFEAIC